MAKREKKEKDRDDARKKNLKEGTMRGVGSVAFFALFIFLILSSFSKGGPAGKILYDALSFLVGGGYFLIPLLCLIMSIAFIRNIKSNFAVAQIIGALLFLLSGLGIVTIIFPGNGGVIGNFIFSSFDAVFGVYATVIFLLAVLIISLLVLFDAALTLETILFWRKKDLEEEEDVREKTPALSKEEERKVDAVEKKEEASGDKLKIKEREEKEKKNSLDEEFPVSFTPFGGKTYVPPPLSLFEKDRGKPGVGDIKANANIIKRTLQNFGIQVEMDEISIGPSVTRYALKPAEGMKLSRIVALQNDLALALAAHPLRIEAPIPGKSLVGIEIPNSTKTIVGLGSMLENEEYISSGKPLFITLGKSVTGKSYFANLAKMPHLLIAGATGSGKSVTIHTLLNSLLFRNSPENLKFIMIDPKRVELTLYNGIPHLLTPVVTDPKKAILSLKWAAREMDRRYDILETESVRDIESYHKNILEPELQKQKGKKIEEPGKLPEIMPYIVIVIDELADIMQTYPRELEAAVVRLAQMSRAVGIHLILSTQRPSVNVITGLIKANISTRMALQVASQIDSRTILDTGGAEKLLGAGDMLYLSGDMSKPVRIQSGFISETEVKEVVKFLKHEYQDEAVHEIDLTGEQSKNAIFSDTLDLGGKDDLYEEARRVVIETKKASTSYLQRKLGIGYARAARLIDTLEEHGVIGPGEGAKPREVIGVGVPSEEQA